MAAFPGKAALAPVALAFVNRTAPG